MKHKYKIKIMKSELMIFITFIVLLYSSDIFAQQTKKNDNKYKLLNEYLESEEYRNIPEYQVYIPIMNIVSTNDYRVSHLVDKNGKITNPLLKYVTTRIKTRNGEIENRLAGFEPDSIDFVEIESKIYYRLFCYYEKLEKIFDQQLFDLENYPGFILLEIKSDINKIGLEYLNNGADSVKIINDNTIRIYKKYELLDNNDPYQNKMLEKSKNDYKGYFYYIRLENGLYLPLKNPYPEKAVELKSKRTTNSRHFIADNPEEITAYYTIRPTSYPLLPNQFRDFNIEELPDNIRSKIKWIELPACYPVPQKINSQSKDVYTNIYDETMYGHSMFVDADQSSPYVWICAPVDGNFLGTIGSMMDDDFWSADENCYNRIHDKFTISGIQNGSTVTAAKYQTFLPNIDPYHHPDCDGIINWAEVKPQTRQMVNNMLPIHNVYTNGQVDMYSWTWFNDVWDGSTYFLASGWPWDRGIGYTNWDVVFNSSGLSDVESRIAGGWYVVGNADYDENNRSPIYWQAVATWNYYSGFMISYIPCCQAPNVIVAHANGSLSTSVCPGTNVNLSVASYTGGGCACGEFRFAWYNGSAWWNGSSFSSATPIYNTSYQNISTNVFSNTTYTARVECSACGSFTSTTTSVNVLSLSSAATSISGTTNICPGNSTTLTVNGGSLGSGANWYWYSGSCGGTFVGTGSSISVSPATNTTYYVRAEGTCNNTACVSTTVTIKTVSTPPLSASASPATIAPGNSSTLSISGGSLGTGAQWVWYTGSCGGTQIGTGTSIVVNPTVNTTYYVRAVGDCNSTECVSVTVYVEGSVTICNGDDVSLTVSGGSLGTGAVWRWYTGSCGGTYVSNGSSIYVTPSTTTTYYVRAEGTCNTTGCASMQVIVNSISTAPTSINATNTYICVGGSTQLTVIGGSLGTGASWQWYSGSCGGTFVGTGSSITVSPTSTTTYYVRASGTCNTTSCASVTITVSPDPTASITPSATTVCSGGTVSFTQTTNGGSGTITDQWQTSTNGTTWSNWTTSVNPTSPALTQDTYFRLVRTATGNGCDQAISNIVFVSVNPDPSITTQPVSPEHICQGGTTNNMTISANGGTGSFNYQWQWYNGSSWVNVSNGNPSGATYSGATSNTFSVSGIANPGNYLYRCYLTQTGSGCDPVTSNQITVQVVEDPQVTIVGEATVCSGGSSVFLASETGGTGTFTYQWQSSPDGSTWANISGATNPTYTTPALTSTTYYRVLLSASGSGCNSATSNTQAVTIHPDPFISTQPAGTTICAGQTHNLSVNAGGGTPALNYQWLISLNGTDWEEIPGATNATYTTNPLGVTRYYRIVVDASGSECDAVLSNVAAVNVQSPVIPGLSVNDYVWSGYANQNWENAANWIVYNGLDYLPAFTIPSVTDNVHIINFASCVANQSNVLSSSNVDCHDINIYSTLTMQNNSNLNVKGNFNNYGTLSVMNSTVTFSGISPQNVRSGTVNFYNVIFNNSNNGNADITLLDDMRVNNSATFTNGIVNTGANKFILNSGASVNMGTSTSFVDGIIQVTNSGMITLPTGQVNTRNIGAGNQSYKIWAPIGINPVASTTTTVRYFFDNTGMPDWWEHGGNMDATLHHVSDREYWLVNSTENFANATLYWRNNNHPNGAVCVHSFCEGDNVFVPSDLSVAYWSGAMWRDAGGSVSGNHDNGNITSALQIPFGGKSQTFITFGSKQNQNPLPVELVKFYAVCDKYSAELFWETASETNNDYFIIEKSRDMQNFHIAGIVKGSGTSNQTNSYKLKVNELFRGDNYFRLKQVDFNGKVNEYNTIVINCDKSDLGSPSMIVYPNPFNNEVNVVIENITDTDFSLEIFDESGRCVFSNSYQSERMDVHKSLNLDYLAPAVYNIRMKSQNHVLNTKIIKK